MTLAAIGKFILSGVIVAAVIDKCSKMKASGDIRRDLRLVMLGFLQASAVTSSLDIRWVDWLRKVCLTGHRR